MRRLVLVLLILAFAAGFVSVASAVGPGDSGIKVAQVQQLLAGYGYTVPVDGHYGVKTEKAVRSWQKSNGLQVDGIAGPATLASLLFARRMGNAVPVAPAGGLNGLPFAPPGLSPCDEAHFYRVQAGLPDRFEALIWRESNCKNTVTSRTGCCVGYLQLHWINWRDHRTIPGLAQCDATWQNVKGDSPEAKQRQMCAARVIYDVVGYVPWAL